MRQKSFLLGCASFAALAVPCLASAAGVAPTASATTAAPTTVASLLALSKSAANARALAAPHAAFQVEMPRHRYPDGSTMRMAEVARLPVTATNVTPRLASPPASVGGFAGIYDGANAIAIGGDLEPPDQGLAVNNGQVVEIINNSLQIFKSDGTAITSPVANATFFNVASGLNLSDPHAEYDPVTKRWFIEELVYGSTFNGFVVAVSKTANPAGAYWIYKIDAQGTKIPGCGAASCLPDYPQVGYDTNGFYIAADLFSNSTGNFVNAGIYALPKALLETGGTLTYYVFVEGDFVVQPAIPAPRQASSTAAGGTEYLMAARNIYDGSTNVRVLAITNTSSLATSSATLSLQSVDVPAEAYTATVPSTQPNVVGPYGNSVGATAAPKLDGGYNAFGGGVKYAGGKLYAALTSGAADSTGLARNIIAWFKVTPTITGTTLSARIAAQGYVTPPDGFSVSFPSFALNKTGVGILGLSITGKSKTAVGGYPSTGFVDFLAAGPTGSLIVSGTGTASDDGFTGYNGATAGTGRWGDYATGTVDAKTGYFYTGNEFIPDTTTHPRGTYANWGTFITQVH